LGDAIQGHCAEVADRRKRLEVGRISDGGCGPERADDERDDCRRGDDPARA
jgi:hypothetical protein